MITQCITLDPGIFWCLIGRVSSQYMLLIRILDRYGLRDFHTSWIVEISSMANKNTTKKEQRRKAAT